MKRNIFIIAILQLFLLIVFANAQSFTGARIAVYNPEAENLEGTESAWLPGATRDRIESNLAKYTPFTLVDNANEIAILQLQKKFTGAAFDENTAIELGKLTSAEYAIFSTIRKTGSTYALTCNLTNLTTGKKTTALVSGKKSTEEIWSIAGCAADEITVKLCDLLRISLNGAQKLALMKGDENLSNEELLKQAQQEEAAFAKQMKEFDEQMKNLKTSTNSNASAETAKLQASRAMAEEKMKSAKERATRLQKEADKKAIDAKLDADRAESQKQRRDEMAKQAAAKAQEVRKSAMENSSSLSQINVVELKKKAVLEIRANIEERIKESNLLLDKETSEKIEAVQNRPYRTVDKDISGNPTIEAKNDRENEIIKIKNDYKEKKESEAKNIANAAQSQKYALLEEIKTDYYTISKTKTVSSLGKDLQYTIGGYDGSKNGWNINFYIYSEGIPLAQQSAILTYDKLTGKSVPDRKDKEAFNEYADNVDLYNSFFSRGDPVLTFELDYNILPKETQYPSQYNISFTAFRVKDTVSGEILCKPTLPKPNAEKAISPQYDISKDWEEWTAWKKALTDKINKEEMEKFKQRVISMGFKDYATLTKKLFRGYCEEYKDELKLAPDAKKGKIYKSVIEFKIPEGVKYIEKAFSDCTALTSVTIPKGIKYIHDGFENCTSLTTVIIQDGAESIDSFAFYNCNSLKTVIIPNSVTSIGYSAFKGCASLENITIPNGVTSIDPQAFEGCAALKNITIPNSVASIKDNTFRGCTSLKNITIPSSVTSIEYSAFEGCASLKKVIFENPNNWEVVDKGKFYDGVLNDPERAAECLTETYKGWSWKRK